MFNLREHLIRLAHEKPELRDHLLPLLEKHAGSPWWKKIDPSDDMGAYVDQLVGALLMPYPAVYNALGMKEPEVKVRGRVIGGKGLVTIDARNVDLDILISPNGTHELKGNLQGNKVRKRFPYMAPAGGIHRGTTGDIINFIEDNLPAAKRIFLVDVEGKRGQYFYSEEDLGKKYKITGHHSSPGTMKEMQGAPQLKGLIGPMYDGRKGDKVLLRYMDQETYDFMTR